MKQKKQIAKNAELTFYVANTGNDEWPGRLPSANKDKTDGPFASITKARDAVRQLKKEQGGLKKPVTVMLRGGTYFPSETITFTAQDSGTKECPITYMAYPGEKVILNGGKRKTGPWKRHRNKIMVCSLPEAKEGKWKFKQLFFNGNRQIRARTPNYDPDNPLYGGWAFVEGPAIALLEPGGSKRTFEYKPGSFTHWKKPSQGEVNIFARYGWWNDIVPIKGVDEKNRLITLAEDASYEIRKGDRFRIENVLEELDQPGEWCLDSEEGKLYFWPPTGSVEESEVIVPKLKQIIKIQGDEDRPVKYINIQSFTFTHTLCTDSAIFLMDTENCSISDNSFNAVGGSGVYLKGYNKENQIVNNEFANAGRESIMLCGIKNKGHPVKNIISYNHCHHCGVIYTGSMGSIYLSLSARNVISHNLIHDLPRMGVGICDYGIGGGTDEDIPECADNIVEYNELYHLNLETLDTGGIYTNYRGKRKEGNIIRYNIIRDMIGCHTTPEGKFVQPYCTWGIYLDDWSSNSIVYGNIIIDNVNGGVMIHGGYNNLIENNIMINGSKNQIHYDSLLTDGCSIMRDNKFVRNIVYYTNPDAYLMWVNDRRDPVVAESDYNVFFHARDRGFTFKGVPVQTFAEWQKLGYDAHSIVADPLFVNLKRGDYRLKPNSPAFKLGFRPIDISKIGLHSGVKSCGRVALRW